MLRSIVSLLLLCAILCQGTWVLAGTTGGLSGRVIDDAGASVAGATVVATSSSGNASTQTDATGHYVFLSLAPDTYTISVTKTGFSPASQAGITVFADQTLTVDLRTSKALGEIGHVTSKSSSSLVKSGTTNDVYSVNAATADKVSAIGGGTNLNSAYSALASQPGVLVGYGGIGWGQTIYIHGASYSQVGVEFDGVPVNRAFDNYNANTLTNLGQQELQVNTGGAGAASSSSTVGGFINQVIRTGTYPGFGTLTAGIGGPNFYHQLKGEAGGATPARTFSYYVGLLGYGQTQRFGDQFNGGTGLTDTLPIYSTISTNTSNFPGAFPYCVNGNDPRNTPAVVAAGLDQGCVGGPFPYAMGFATTALQDRESILNVHVGIPHKHDQGRDDVQVLYSGSYLRSLAYDSLNDQGGLQFLQNNLFNVGGVPGTYVPTYADGIIAGNGVTFGQTVPLGSGPLPTQTYFFPSSPTARLANAALPSNIRDGTENDSQVFKIQYQKNIGSTMYLRALGYTFFSDWLQNAPVYASLNNSPNLLVAPYSRDYELITHTRGAELQFADQLNSQHLLTATANYTTAGVSRYNNSTFTTQPSTGATNLTDAAGNCYRYTTMTQAPCLSSSTQGTFADPTREAYRSANCAPPVGTGATPCAPFAAGRQWQTTFLGVNGTLNKVTPVFTSYSVTDQFRPNDKWLFNAGIRVESYKYNLVQSNTPDYNFWFHAAQNELCYDPANGNAPVVGPNRAFNTPPLFVGLNCPVSAISGLQTLHPNGQNGALLYTNDSPASYTKTRFEPRLSGTYTLNADTVLRFSAGRYANPSNTATMQYLNASAKGASTFDFQNFFGLGFTSTAHDVNPSVSTNIDFSLEKHIKGTDISYKLSPYYRYVTGQTQDFFIGAGFVSAIPTGNETAYGVEFQLAKGDPTKNGFSGQFSYTWNRAHTKFTNLPNGTNAVDPINGEIDSYNALTSSGNRFGVKGAMCYNNTAANGTPAPAGDCSLVGGNIVMTPAGVAAGDVINPYYTASAQPLLDRNASYPIYQTFPNPLSNPGYPDASMSINWPQVLAGFVNYKHDKLALSASAQMIQGVSGGSAGGGQYGSPLSVQGLDPRTCANNQGNAGITTVNPGFANYVQCGTSDLNLGILNIPDPYTGKFDSVGQYQNPWLLNINGSVHYDLSNKVSANLVLANLFTKCFGGSSTPWSAASPPGAAVCGYDTNTGFVGTQPGAGFFNGTSPSDPANGSSLFDGKHIRYPYSPLTSRLPFSAYLTVQFKL